MGSIKVYDLLVQKVAVQIKGRNVYIQAWRYNVRSVTGGEIDECSYLDTDVEENTKGKGGDYRLFYGGVDNQYRLKQEIVLGIGESTYSSCAWISY